MVAVQRLWPGETVVCIASGPSLTKEDVEHVKGKARVIVVNDNHRLAPWADVLYSSDQHWYRHYKGVPEFKQCKFGIQPLRPKPEWGISVLRNTGDRGIELSPSGLKTGRNSGAAAVNLAVHFGAARIVLLGYDMGRCGKQLGRHWFGEHPRAIRQGAPYHTFIGMFATMVEPLKKLGVDVINCSRETNLQCFPRRPLREVLA